MKYDHYQLEDFLEDDYFISWAVNPTEDKNIYWQNWLDEYPEKELIVAKAKAFITGVDYKYQFQPEKVEMMDAYENIIKKSAQQSGNNKVKNTFSIAKYAAVFFILGIGLTWYLVNPSEKDAIVITPVEYITRHTEKGQKLNIFLADGTEILLNAESSIRFPKVFAKDKREVFLKGEAFFDVHKDKNSPFIIFSEKVKTTVLGTSFNIRSYQDEKNISVAVVSGSVKVEGINEKETVISDNVLQPNEIIRLNKSDQSLVKERVEIEKIIAWKNKIIIFQKADFQEITKELSRWYDVEFIFENDIEIKGNFTGKFKNKSLKVVLDGLGFSSKIQYKIEGNKVYFFNKKPM